MGIIKMPSGELRSEIPYSLAFAGNSDGVLFSIKPDDDVLGVEPFHYPKPNHSFRMREVEIISKIPVVVSLCFLPHEAKPKEVANWSVISHFNRKIESTCGYDSIDIMPMQWFVMKSTPLRLSDATGEVLVTLNGLLRKPVGT